jgi:hypothetical protein
MEGHDPKALQKMQDSLDSMHTRLDRFYSWAAELQVQIRNLQGRQSFLESQANIEISQAEDMALQARLEKIRKL